jgi:WD40 repeat protein
MPKFPTKSVLVISVLSLPVCQAGRTALQGTVKEAAETAWPIQFDQHGDRLPRNARARLGTVRFRHGDSILWVTSSHNGQILASASRDQTIRLWKAISGKEQQRFLGHQGPVFSAIFSGDDKALASGSEDQTLRIWSADTGKEIALFREKPFILGKNFAVAPDGKTLVAIGFEGFFRGVLRTWELPSGREIRHSDTGLGSTWVNLLTFSPDGKTLAMTESDDTFYLLDAMTGRILRRFSGHRPVVRGSKIVSGVEAIAFSPDGLLLASGATDQTVRLWQVATGKQVHCLEGHQGDERRLYFPAGDN